VVLTAMGDAAVNMEVITNKFAIDLLILIF